MSQSEGPAAGLFLRLLQRKELTARRAGFAIAFVTLIITVGGGMLMTVVDRKDFPNIGRGMWWAVQTVTTVGYGDDVPKTALGQVIGSIVMVTGIGFLAVVTASITATFVEEARRRLGRRDARLVSDIEALDARLERIERLLTDLEAGRAGAPQRPSSGGS